MIHAFDLRCSSPSPFSEWEDEGRTYFKKRWPDRPRQLAAFVDDTKISGDGLSNAWFGRVDSHVFISHAHKDESIALGLAGLLSTVGISSFVDSLIWGEARKLLREIDEQFCWTDDRRETFNYAKRNYSTSHVNMMLGAALAETIDRADAVIFINTPNAIRAEDAKHASREITGSPWIYHELVMTKIARRRGYRGRVSAAMESLVERSAEAGFEILHTPPLDHLSPLSRDDLFWLCSLGKRGLSALDALYEQRA